MDSGEKTFLCSFAVFIVACAVTIVIGTTVSERESTKRCEALMAASVTDARVIHDVCGDRSK